MFNINEKALLRVDNVDYGLVNGKHNSLYWGKLVYDNTAKYLAYVPDDGSTILGFINTFTVGNETFDPLDLLRQVGGDNHSEVDDHDDHKEEPLLNIEELVSLKQAGFSVDDIIKMKKERVF